MLIESSHPSLKAKISKLRQNASPGEVRRLANEIAGIIAVEAGARAFSIAHGSEGTTVLNSSFETQVATPQRYTLVPILRSGLSMVSGFQSLLPDENVPVYHLGIFRDKGSLAPVEYYNKLPTKCESFDLAIVLDPVIATGGTATAVIHSLK
jgi:uracil phosphoribosyltransferase